MRRAAQIALAASFAVLAIPCQAAPEELSLAISPEGSMPAGKDIDGYPAAIDAIVRVMVNSFGLPAPRGKLLIYRTREEFEDGLVEHLKIRRELARATAKFAQSAVGSHNVLVNEPTIAEKDWAYRVELLAHELTHGVQLELANRGGLLYHQWLQEGFAEWMAFSITHVLGLDDMARARARLADKVKGARSKQGLPEIIRLDRFGEWTAARNAFGYDATYSLSFLVADFLVARHSLKAVIEYFRSYRDSSDSTANFKKAFGESVGDFEEAVRLHLQQMLR